MTTPQETAAHAHEIDKAMKVLEDAIAELQNQLALLKQEHGILIGCDPTLDQVKQLAS